MRTILHELPSGSVGNYPPNPAVLAVMTGAGFGWANPQIAWEIYKFTIPSEEADWPGFSVVFATEWVLALSEGKLTEDEALDLFARRTQLRRGYLSYAFIEEATLPDQFAKDRYFRDALTWDATQDNRCRCDMPKARVIHMDRIRKVRNEALERESGSRFRQPPEIEALFTPERKATLQQLRDIPQDFDLARFGTPPTLKKAWPQDLTR